MPEFYVIFARKKTSKMQEFLRYLPENALTLHANFPKNISPRFFRGGHPPVISYVYVSGLPTSVLVIIMSLMACAPLEIIVPRLCPGSEIFLAPPLNVAVNR